MKTNIYSQIDYGFGSLLNFSLFFYVKYLYGINNAGYFAIILSISAILETLQQGFYERPTYLKIPTNFWDFNFNIFHIYSIAGLFCLIVDVFIWPNRFLPSLLFSTSLVLIRNIKITDYINNNVQSSAKRSIVIYISNFIFILIFHFFKIDLVFYELLFWVSVVNYIIIIRNKEKIFAKRISGKNKNFYLPITSILILVKNRLPLWALLPFGLGLIGIYETFRNLIEIFLLPSKGYLNILLKDIEKNNNKTTFFRGIYFGLITSIVAIFSFKYIFLLDLFNHKELNNWSTLVSLVFIILSFWITEVTSMIFQKIGKLKFELKRRFIALIIFVLINLTLFNFINFKIFLFLVSFMYFIEIIPLFTKKYLNSILDS